VGAILEAPAGFITDLASVPRLPFVYLVAGNRAHAAAVIHDYLYGSRVVPVRSDADAVFREAMGTDPDVSAWIAWTMWAAVRAWGWRAWRSAPGRYRVLNQDIIAEGDSAL